MTEIWGRDEIKNMDLWEDETKKLDLLGTKIKKCSYIHKKPILKSHILVKMAKNRTLFRATFRLNVIPLISPLAYTHDTVCAGTDVHIGDPLPCGTIMLSNNA